MAERAGQSADVIIVGGGVMGCASAYYLARGGARVLVLERSVPGAEASSAAAGMLAAQAEAQCSGPMTDLMRLSARRYPAFARALYEATGIDVGYRACGSVRVAFDSQRLRALLAATRWQRSGRGAVRSLSARGIRQLEPGLARPSGGVLYPRDGRVDPKLLLRAVHIAAQNSGARFVAGRHVRRLDIQRGRVSGVTLEDGTRHRAGSVVVAAGSWTSLVGGHELRAASIVPARGQILELSSPAPVVQRVVFGPDCYLVPRDDGRTLVGSTLEFVGYQRSVTAQAVRDLLSAAIQLAPGLAEAGLEHTWSNFRPYTPDHLPVLGRGLQSGVLFASGHYRTGILLAPITAEIIARLAQGRRSPLPLAPFSPERFSAALPGPERLGRSSESKNQPRRATRGGH